MITCNSETVLRWTHNAVPVTSLNPGFFVPGSWVRGQMRNEFFTFYPSPTHSSGITLSLFHEMDEHITGKATSDPSDAEPGYVHSVAPDPRRLNPLLNPVSCNSLGCVLNSFDIHFSVSWNFEGFISITEQKNTMNLKTGLKEGPVFIKRNLTPSEYLVNLAG